MLKSNLSRLFFFLIHLKILSGFTAISSTRSSAAPGKRLHNNLPLGNTDMLNAKWKVFCIYYSLNRVCFAFCHLSCQEQEQLPVMKSGPQVLIGSFYELVQGELVLLAVQRNHRLSPALVEFAWLWIKGVLLDFFSIKNYTQHLYISQGFRLNLPPQFGSWCDRHCGADRLITKKVKDVAPPSQDAATSWRFT